MTRAQSTEGQHGHRCLDCGKRWYDQHQNRGYCPRCGSEPIGRGRARKLTKPKAPVRPLTATELQLRELKAQARRRKASGPSESQRKWRDRFAAKHQIASTASYEWDTA